MCVCVFTYHCVNMVMLFCMQLLNLIIYDNNFMNFIKIHKTRPTCGNIFGCLTNTHQHTHAHAHSHTPATHSYTAYPLAPQNHTFTRNGTHASSRAQWKICIAKTTDIFDINTFEVIISRIFCWTIC